MTYSIAYVYGGSAMVHEQFAASLARQTAHYPPTAIMGFSSPRPAHTRNIAIDAWATSEDMLTDDWLFFVDTDMQWNPHAFKVLYEAAQDGGPGVYGGLCFQYNMETMVPAPTVYFRNEDRWSHVQPLFYPRDELFEVDATGAAFILMHRDVVEAIPAPWFEDRYRDGELMGNDLVFCEQAREAGFPVFVHSGAKVGHMKSMVVDESAMDNWKLVHRVE